jgi:hypothetical protein
MFRSNLILQSVALSNEELQNLAPSIFASQPVADVSDRYSFLPTSSVLDGYAKSWLDACPRRRATRSHSRAARVSKTSHSLRSH